jgi:hypothetical protein
VTSRVAIAPAEATPGSPVEIAYAFTIAPDAPRLSADTRVFVHFVDQNGDVAWTDDHQPPTPADRWAPGTTVRYIRTVFVAGVAQIGRMHVEIGLYNPSTRERIPITGAERSLRSYRATDITIHLRNDAPPVIFARGWYAPEGPISASDPQWRWSEDTGVLSFRNPHRDVALLLDIDEPLPASEPRTCSVFVGPDALTAFSLTPERRQIQRIPITREVLGDGDRAVVALKVDRPLIPTEAGHITSADSRSLGVRVFHAYVQLQ